MAYYKLIREKPDGKAVQGTLYSVRHTVSHTTGNTLEHLKRVASTLENADYLIPALCYKAQVNISPKFDTLMPLLINVPGRTGIRIHYGFKPGHSQGCVLLTHRNEYQNLVRTLLAEQNALEEIIVEISDYKPGPRTEIIDK